MLKKLSVVLLVLITLLLIGCQPKQVGNIGSDEMIVEGDSIATPPVFDEVNQEDELFSTPDVTIAPAVTSTPMVTAMPSEPSKDKNETEIVPTPVPTAAPSFGGANLTEADDDI